MSSEAIQILSPSKIKLCSLRETIIEALHNSIIEVNIILETHAETLLSNMSLDPIGKLFTSPPGLIFACCGIARAMPIEINKMRST